MSLYNLINFEFTSDFRFRESLGILFPAVYFQFYMIVDTNVY